MRRVPLIGPRTTGFQGLRVLKLALVKRMQLATRARGLHLIGVGLLDADTFLFREARDVYVCTYIVYVLRCSWRASLSTRPPESLRHQTATAR